MTNRTRALGHRILGALKNERVIVSSVPSRTPLTYVTLINGRTGKSFAVVRENEWGQFFVMTSDGAQEWHDDFSAVLSQVRGDSRYPKPAQRRTAALRTHRQPVALSAAKVG